MGAIWLHSLPDVLRGVGLTVEEYAGWEIRSRSSGGYDALLAVQVHHTASPPSSQPWEDQAWMWDNSPDAPIGALYLARSGVWTIGAAGATNTSGKGGPLQTSGGTIPLDSANRYVLSIEAANDGVGEPWPQVQIDSYVRGVTALCDAYGLPYWAGDVHAHFEWTSRKIDPAGPSPYAVGAASWDMNKFRSDLGVTTPPPPGGDMLPIQVRFKGYLNVFLLSGTYTHLTGVLSEHFTAAGAPLIVSELHTEGVKSALFQSGLTLADMIPHGGEDRDWTNGPPA